MKFALTLLSTEVKDHTVSHYLTASHLGSVWPQTVGVTLHIPLNYTLILVQDGLSTVPLTGLVGSGDRTICVERQ
jgi:hypothetical protein